MAARPHPAKTRIAVECLRCGHCGSIGEAQLRDYGEKPGAPIASFVKRLTCQECGSHSVKAWRVENETV